MLGSEQNAGNFSFSTGCSVNIVFFPQNIVIFLNSASSSAAELVFYLPGVFTHTEGKQRKARVRNNLKSLKKNTIFIEHPVPRLVEA